MRSFPLRACPTVRPSRDCKHSGRARARRLPTWPCPKASMARSVTECIRCFWMRHFRRALASPVRTRQESEGGFVADVTLTDPRGQILVEVVGLQGRPLQGASASPGLGEESGLYQFGWSVSSSPQASAPSGRWLVVAREPDEVAAGIVAELRARGADCVCVDLAGLRAALPAEQVVCLWRRGGDEADVEAACRLAGEGLKIVQLLAQQEQAARLWWVTHGAVAVTAQEPANVAQAS